MSLCVVTAVAQGCSDQQVERFATRDESGIIRFVVCATELPATALIWSLGPNKVIGDADDSLVWSSDGPWTDTSQRIAELESTVDWAEGLGVSVEGRTFPGSVLARPPADEMVLALGGNEATLEDFDRRCGE